MLSPCLRTSAVPAESHQAPKKKSSRVVRRPLFNKTRGIVRDLSTWLSRSVCLASATSTRRFTTSLWPRHGTYPRDSGPAHRQICTWGLVPIAIPLLIYGANWGHTWRFCSHTNIPDAADRPATRSPWRSSEPTILSRSARRTCQTRKHGQRNHTRKLRLTGQGRSTGLVLAHSLASRFGGYWAWYVGNPLSACGLSATGRLDIGQDKNETVDYLNINTDGWLIRSDLLSPRSRRIRRPMTVRLELIP